MTDMFSALAKTEDDRSEATGMRRAAIAANARASHRFAKFVAADASEREAKLDFLRQDILNTVVEACSEHGVEGKERIQTVLDGVMAKLRTACSCGGDCDGKGCDEEGCECGGKKGSADKKAGIDSLEAIGVRPTSTTCEDCGAPLDTSAMECPVCGGGATEEQDPPHAGEYDGDLEEATRRYHENRKKDLYEAVGSRKTADGDTYQQETIDLPTATADGTSTGLGRDGSPEINKGKVPEGGLDPIDVGSVRNKSEMQEIRPKDFEEKLKEFDPATSPVSEQVNIDTPIGEEQVGDRTDTFSTPDGQSSAVTSSWRVELDGESR